MPELMPAAVASGMETAENRAERPQEAPTARGGMWGRRSPSQAPSGPVSRFDRTAPQSDREGIHHMPHIAATICKTEGCSLPVKRNSKGWGMGYCADHVNVHVVRSRQPGSRSLKPDGYIDVKLADGRIVGEHRVVMEGILGRQLERGETVHHINGVRDDNRPENLEIWYSPQPYGQRVKDLLRYAVTHHRDALVALLSSDAAIPETTQSSDRGAPHPAP